MMDHVMLVECFLHFLSMYFYLALQSVFTRKDNQKILTNLSVCLQLPRNDRYRWVQSEGFQDHSFQVLHLYGIVESGRSFGISEDLIQFIVDSRLYVLVEP